MSFEENLNQAVIQSMVERDSDEETVVPEKQPTPLDLSPNNINSEILLEEPSDRLNLNDGATLSENESNINYFPGDSESEPNTIEITQNDSEEIAQNFMLKPDIQDKTEKHVQFAKTNLQPIDLTAGKLFKETESGMDLRKTNQLNISDFYVNNTQDIELTLDHVETNNRENDMLLEDFKDILTGLSSMEQIHVPNEVQTWINGLQNLIKDPNMNTISKELLLALRMQIFENKRITAPFTLPFSQSDIINNLFVLDRQNVASTPFKSKEKIKISINQQKKQMVREQAIFIQPHKLYRKIPKPCEGFVIYGACFGQKN